MRWAGAILSPCQDNRSCRRMEVEVPKAQRIPGGAGRMRNSSRRFPKAAFLGGSVPGQLSAHQDSVEPVGFRYSQMASG